MENDDATEQQHAQVEVQRDSSRPHPRVIRSDEGLLAVLVLVPAIIVVGTSLLFPGSRFVWILIALISLVWLMIIPVVQVRKITFKGEDEGERFKAEDDARKTLAQIIGGAILLFGAISAYQNVRLAEKAQSDASTNTRKTFELAAKGQITDRFSKAVVMLADKEHLESRLGGIYALEGVAKDSEDYYWPTMVLLTDYLREHYPWNSPWKNSPWIKNEEYGQPGTADVSAILTVIGRLNGLRAIDRDLDLAHTYLRGAWLKNTNYRNLQIRSANLSGATFLNVDFTKTSFIGSCLDKAKFLAFENKQTDVTGARFDGASISGTDFTGAKGLSPDQFQNVTWNERPKFPNNFSDGSLINLGGSAQQPGPCDLH
ncbi:MAG TPA: pentapeptide repeat-containing protein [Pyrinomonadaceae bacterium]|nr:pentapeptide repeat-containing protein [Pyrinomonadaceae bacterium]